MKKRIFNSVIILMILTILALAGIVTAKENDEEIKENQIDELAIDNNEMDENIEISYLYNQENNTVLVTIVSKVELKHTKPTWKLSENKKQYTKTFTQNQKYSTPVEDIYGNVTNINIEIKDIQPLKIEVKYGEIDEKNNTIVVKMISNTELKDTKPTWSYSENKREYVKVFTENSKYSTPVEDINGNIEMVEINVNQLKDLKLEISEEYDSQNNISTIKIKSNIEMKNTKPSWKLSDDGLIYTKNFQDNTNYTTPITFINDMTKQVSIIVTKIDKVAPKIDLEYKYNENDSVTITMISNEKLADTKPTWDLSEDGRYYTKTYYAENDSVTPVEDIHGNSTQVRIFFKKKMTNHFASDGSKIFVGYIYTANNDVIVQVTSNVQFQDTKPTWRLSTDKYSYTKTFTSDTDYSTPFVNINNTKVDIPIMIDWFYTIIVENGVYGQSGALIHGVSGGSNLEYYRWGNGPNVFFATFCVHGFEDNWTKDGQVLVDIANNFYNNLVNSKDISLSKKWTIYVIKKVNPDGLNLGTTNNGPGRTTVYSSVGKGIDINRSWQTGSSYKRYTDNRNYNGTQGFQAYEAAALRDFLLSHKAINGQTVLVDLHGWENQLIGDAGICGYYKQQYSSCSTRNYNSYGTQYLITWGRQNLGARTALVELPSARNYAEVNSMGLSDKYINATLNMLKGI